MDMLRLLEEISLFTQMVLQSHSLYQLSNIDQTSDQIVTEGCGQIDTNDRSTSFVIKLVGVTGTSSSERELQMIDQAV